MAAARLTRSRLLAKVRRAFVAAADPARAPFMQAYMKSAMPYHGVSTVPLRAICKEVFAGHAIDDAATWRDDVLALWRGAKFREERYAAIALAKDRRARAFQTMASLPMYEELIVTGAWWDFVDAIAAGPVTSILENEPKPMRRAMLAWSRDADMWKRRTSILCQVPRKAKTDLTLLYACIEPSLARKEFFLRKAIGWALRQYAWTDPEEIVRFVETNRERLSPLSVREALKNVAPATGPSSSSTFSLGRAARRKKTAGDSRTLRRARRA